MADVEVGLADGTKLIVENATEDDVLAKLASRRSGALGDVALDARGGAYHVIPEQVVYVRYLPQEA
jgi:hypothetical protein